MADPGSEEQGPQTRPEAAHPRRWWQRRRVYALFFAFSHTLGGVAAVDAIMSVRTAQGAIAWSVSLVSFPYVALPAYLLLGRSRFEGYQRELERIEVAKEEVIQRLRQDLEPYLVPVDPSDPVYTGLVELGRYPAMIGNDLELLVDGERTFEDILAGIEAAERQIVVQFYIVKDDGLGRRVKEALVRKARAGVEVYLLYDEVGSLGLSKNYLNTLRSAGVHVAAFNTTKGRGNRFQLNFRNHRKIVVVDSRSAWIGGHNIGDEYLGLDPKIGPWRDTHVRVDGPAALVAQAVFASDWHWATEEIPPLDWSVHPFDRLDAGVLIFPSDPAGDYEGAQLLFLQVIMLAEKSLWIASPYFVPDEGIIAALEIAALRGVDVRLLIADKSDNALVDLAAWSFLPALIESGVKVYRYDDGFLHQKVFLLDGDRAGIGTMNFDNRSFRLNFEITLLADDPELCADVRAMLEDDFERSSPVTRADAEARTWAQQFATRLARLLAPVL